MQKLANLIEADAAELWDLQEIEHAKKKNPFRQGATSISGLFSLFLVAVLLAGASGLSPSQTTKNGNKSRVDVLHIVAICRQITLWLCGALSLPRFVPKA